MRIAFILFAGLLLTAFCRQTSAGPVNGTTPADTSETRSTDTIYPGYHLVWQDEFNGAALDTTSWNHEVGGTGWGNHELEYYTSTGNAYLKDGNLVIEAKKETIGSNLYSSARLTTEGKHEFRYGRIDMRAKLPVMPGMWPALWMLGNDLRTAGWPYCGEIDIMELIGKTPATVYGTLHWKKDDGSAGSSGKSYALATGDFSQDFHLFSLVWDKDNYRILVDNVVYASLGTADIAAGYNPFRHPFFLVFNVAVGGDWPGPPDGTTVFPEQMLVDYVRVYQQ